MDLVKATPASGAPRRLVMSAEDRKLAEIELATVERMYVSKEIRMVGKVDFDETQLQTVASRIPGENRLERLYVDYTGVTVQKGEHLVLVYSPELLTAQEELLEARKRMRSPLDDESSFLAESNQRAYQSARQKLLFWGLTAAQLDEIEERGTAEDHVMITSPVSGVVIRKWKNQGDYVRVGSEIYQIADLSSLWIWLHAYEQDLSWIRYGQEVAVYTEAYPGQTFHGTISFIDPVLDEKTRTVRVRVNIENLAGKLKPGMFVRGVVRSRLALGGKVMDAALAGKWISPMHPEIVKDGPGACDVCGMDLVPAEELGIVSPDDMDAKPLVIPATAVLLTGKRAVVYVAVEGQDRPTYEGREVILGPRAGEYYLVQQGLGEHEKVVKNGAFKIDSALQIQAKPSMMSMPAATYAGMSSELFRKSLEPLYTAYFVVHMDLAMDDPDGAQSALRTFAEALQNTVTSDLSPSAREHWKKHSQNLQSRTRQGVGAQDIEGIRKAFGPLSNSMIQVQEAFGHAGSRVHHDAYCPMAFQDQGAAWLQLDAEILNPYFGASMLRCGTIRQSFAGLGGE
jgi:Cu(I)/Ag(I) efflux system membrane fusion protein